MEDGRRPLLIEMGIFMENGRWRGFSRDLETSNFMEVASGCGRGLDRSENGVPKPSHPRTPSLSHPLLTRCISATSLAEVSGGELRCRPQNACEDVSADDDPWPRRRICSLYHYPNVVEA